MVPGLSAESAIRRFEKMKSNLEERFWAKVRKTDTCWVWTGAKRNGYGHFFVARIGGVDTYDYAHRISYRLLVGPIPEHLQLDHLCRNRSCLNPAHLEPVTPKENAQRGLTGKYQSNRTHCPAGHPYDDVNTGWNRNGAGRVGKYCKACLRARTAAKRAAKRQPTREDDPCDRTG